MSTCLQKISEGIIVGNENQVKDFTQKAVNEGEDVEGILNEGLLVGMSIIGEKFRKSEIFIPEVLVAANAMKEGMQIIRPLIVEKGIKGKGVVLIGTVKGDYHDIGKNLVVMMMEGAGFEVIDLGVDILPEKFVENIKSKNAQILGMSALLTTTMMQMKNVIDAVRNEDQLQKIKIIVGGAPITQKYADEIGADGYAANAGSAVDKVKELLGL
jgi:5-methyltetrahydrofolate--homocysteine methyltransferase